MSLTLHQCTFAFKPLKVGGIAWMSVVNPEPCNMDSGDAGEVPKLVPQLKIINASVFRN